MTTVGIVTGAGSGMGAACAARLIDSVDLLLLADVNADAAAAVADSLSGDGGRGRAEVMRVDVTDEGDVELLAKRAAEAGHLGAVVHAAGLSPTMADWSRVLEVDLVGTALVVDRLAPQATVGSAFVCFASLAPHLPGRTMSPEIDTALDEPLHPQFLERIRDAVGPPIEDSGAAYTWAKYGVLRLVRREAVRLGPRRARICSLSPGLIDTPMGRQEAAAQPIKAELLRRTPLGRYGRSEEIADVVAFLTSEQAGFVSGIDVLVDGGLRAALGSATSDA